MLAAGAAPLALGLSDKPAEPIARIERLNISALCVRLLEAAPVGLALKGRAFRLDHEAALLSRASIWDADCGSWGWGQA
jgi:hypothetical protein